MAGYIEDRWFKKAPDGKRTIPTERHGKGQRYKVAGIPGVRARSFPDKQKKAAEAWLAKAVSDANKGEFIDPRDGNMLLREYVNQHWWPSRTGDPATLQTVGHRIRNQILPHLGATPLRLIKVDTLRMWLKQLEGEVAPGTAVVAWGYLNNILECAVDDERISKNPCRAPTLKPPSAPRSKARAWTRARVLAVQAQLPAQYRVLVDIGAGAGLRQGEALALSEDDIDMEGGFIHVRRQIRSIDGKLAFSLPKGNKTRVVPMPDHLAQRLAQHLERFPATAVTLPWKDPRPATTKVETKERAPQTHKLLVSNRNGNAVRANMWNEDHWKWALAAAGVIPEPKRVPRKSGTGTRLVYGATHEMGFHSLRHTYASVQLDSRENPVAVSKWLGHADASITLRVYGHFMPEADGRGREALDAWFARTDDPAPSSPAAPQGPVEAALGSDSLPRQTGELRQLEVSDMAPDLHELAEAAV
jgi:integrase